MRDDILRSGWVKIQAWKVVSPVNDCLTPDLGNFDMAIKFLRSETGLTRDGVAHGAEWLVEERVLR
jgi:hypothetical protein